MPYHGCGEQTTSVMTIRVQKRDKGQEASDTQRKSASAPSTRAAHRALRGAVPALVRAQRHCPQVSSCPLADCDPVLRASRPSACDTWAP